MARLAFPKHLTARRGISGDRYRRGGGWLTSRRLCWSGILYSLHGLHVPGWLLDRVCCKCCRGNFARWRLSRRGLALRCLLVRVACSGILLVRCWRRRWTGCRRSPRLTLLGHSRRRTRRLRPVYSCENGAGKYQEPKRQHIEFVRNSSGPTGYPEPFAKLEQGLPPTKAALLRAAQSSSRCAFYGWAKRTWYSTFAGNACHALDRPARNNDNAFASDRRRR